MTDYKIGYGKPPKASRFQPGKSGNPKGRPKAISAKLEELMKQALDVPMTYREHGRVKSSTRREVILRALTQKALKGDVPAAMQLFKQVRLGSSRGPLVRKILITDWLPDFPGETADQKNIDVGRRSALQGAQAFKATTDPK